MQINLLSLVIEGTLSRRKQKEEDQDRSWGAKGRSRTTGKVMRRHYIRTCHQPSLCLNHCLRSYR